MLKYLMFILILGHVSIIKDMDFRHLSMLDYGVLATGSALILAVILSWKRAK